VVIGGATRAQVAADLQKHYTLPKTPSPRSVTGWLADSEVKRLIGELEDIRRGLQPGEEPGRLLPEPVDAMQVDMDLWTFLDDHPAYAALLQRVELDPAFNDDAAPRRILVETDSGEALETAAAELIEGWDFHIAKGAEPGYKERVAAVLAEAA
jgi:hypothetical protein